MAKQRKIEISIPKPCSEDWDKMTLDEQGKFCSHCNKTVIDFSGFTDRELAAYFSKAKEKVCGNFHNTQLNRLIAIQEQSNTPFFHKMLLGASLVAGVATNVSGQNVPTTTNPVQQIQPKHWSGPNTVLEPSGGDTTHIISGVVVDINGNPIPFVTIALHNENGQLLGSFISSGDGHFSIEIDSSSIGKTVALVAKTNNELTFLKIQIVKLPITDIPLVMHSKPAHNYTIRGGAESQTVYIVDGVKVQKDSILGQSPTDFKKELLERHLGIPASQEGPSTPH